MTEDHDGGYRLLFSHPQMVTDLLRGFVREGWAGELDLGSLERCGESEVGEDLERREDDMVWRLRWKGRTHLYILIEFQSGVDPYMAVRAVSYVSLRWQELIRSREVPRRGELPAVILLIVYNGRRRWSAPLDVSELVRDVPQDMIPYIPRLRYLLVDGHREDVLEGGEGNLVSLLFELERGLSPEAIDHTVARLADRLAGEEFAELRRAFTTFLLHSLLPARFPGARIPAIQDLEEIRPMLRDTVKGWTRQWLEEGRQEGRREGLLEGEARLLLRQIERKFGALGKRNRERIRRADAEQLLEWGERLLTARSLDDVFQG